MWENTSVSELCVDTDDRISHFTPHQSRTMAWGGRCPELSSLVWTCLFIYPLSVTSPSRSGHSQNVHQETYINHGAAGLEGEDDVDMGAIGHSSAGGVGQEELQAFNQLPGDTHFNGTGLAQHGDCE